YLLVRIMTAAAAESTNKKIADFSFKKGVETLAVFFVRQLNELIRGTKKELIAFFQKVTSAIAWNCMKPPTRATA
ncbi:MAG: hypothetical protein KAT65_09150, partial [Methanophagales archaeon]|nr:hypothetical protein [Methanophagales archaeon]